MNPNGGQRAPRKEHVRGAPVLWLAGQYNQSDLENQNSSQSDPPPRAPTICRPGFPFGFLGAGGRLPKERRGRVFIAHTPTIRMEIRTWRSAIADLKTSPPGAPSGALGEGNLGWVWRCDAAISRYKEKTCLLGRFFTCSQNSG